MLTIFSARTGRIRRVVADDTKNDAQLLVLHAPRLGEAVQQGRAVSQEELSELTGLVPVDDRYTVLDVDFVVVHAFTGDPDCGDVAPPGHSLEAHPHARGGWRHARDLTWQRSLADIDNELELVESQRTHLQSPEWQAFALAPPEPYTQGEINQRIAALTRRLAELNTERVRRAGPRTL